VALDLGNWIARKSPPYGYNTELSLQCLKRMQYAAVGIGEKEVSAGLDEVDRLLAEYGLTGLNANLIDRETGQPHFTPYMVIPVNDLKIGVTSILGGDAVIARTIKEREGIEVEDPLTTAQNMLDVLHKKKVDLTVLIAHTGLQKGELLADSLAGYDVILIGHGGKPMNEPKKEKGVILASPGSRSNHLGYLTMVVENHTVTNFEGKSYQLQQDDGPRDEFVQSLTWTHLELDDKGNRIRNKPASSETDKSAKPDAAQEEAKPTHSYLGNENCRTCHADIYASYAETPHASAFQAIAESDSAWQKPECWNCHTLGYGEPTGHPTDELQPDLWNVQCESCHGMGTDHVRGKGMAKVSEETCRGCHVKEWSPDFDYKRMISKVAHKSHKVGS
jgi:hypothetical protein